MSSSPVVANGVLYITTQTRLYAVQKAQVSLPEEGSPKSR
jgi:hypothetical protein